MLIDTHQLVFQLHREALLHDIEKRGHEEVDNLEKKLSEAQITVASLEEQLIEAKKTRENLSEELELSEERFEQNKSRFEELSASVTGLTRALLEDSCLLCQESFRNNPESLNTGIVSYDCLCTRVRIVHKNCWSKSLDSRQPSRPLPRFNCSCGENVVF